MRTRTLALTADQRAELERARDPHLQPYFRERCATLLKVAAGRSPRRVDLTGLHRPRQPKTVCRRLGAHAHGAPAASTQRPRGRGGFPPRPGEQLVEAARQAPALHRIDRPRWHWRDLREAVP